MTELANTTKGEMSLLDNLAAQAQMCVASARMNLLQLGRVLTEAKPLVKHGEWEAWVRTNADMSPRAAQNYMQAYETFGLNPDIAKLGTSKTMKLLPLSDEDRKELFSEHDVQAMSTRELDAAIKAQKEKLKEEARAEVQKEIDAEREARKAAEQRAQEAESRPPEVSPELAARVEAAEKKAKAQQELVDQFSKRADEADAERKRTKQENERLRRENKEQAELLEEQQEDYARVQEELLNVKSSIAKGDAERVPLDQLTPEAFAAAVRAFIGSCARMPHMSAAFSVMEDRERQEYDELLQTVESWAEGSRKALKNKIIDGEVFG